MFSSSCIHTQKKPNSVSPLFFPHSLPCLYLRAKFKKCRKCTSLPQRHAKLFTSQITFSQHCPINSLLARQHSINISVIDSHRADNVHTTLLSEPPTVPFFFAQPVSVICGLPLGPTETCAQTAGSVRLCALVALQKLSSEQILLSQP